MLRPATTVLLGGALLSLAALGGCADNGPPSGQPSFYIDLATTDAALDANAAQSMISGYRSNNGLGAVAIDPELMRLAAEQARVMAARDKLDHDAGRPFQERIRKSGFDANHCFSSCSICCAVCSNIGNGDVSAYIAELKNNKNVIARPYNGRSNPVIHEYNFFILSLSLRLI